MSRVLGRWPTPVRPLSGPGVPDGALWVKDEAASGALYGGNKVRKLELLLDDAVGRGRGHVATIGGVGSHHVLATAIYGAEAGLRTHALLFGQPDTPHVRSNAAQIAHRCASWRRTATVDTVAPDFARMLLSLRRQGIRAAPILPGGSSALGARGWVSGAEEVAAAVEGGALPLPRRVYVPVGSGGTAAGLAAGFAWLGLDVEVVGVRVAGRIMANRWWVRHLARRVLAALGAPKRVGAVRIEDGWIGDGYGCAGTDILELVARGADLGLSLEATYSAKALACCLEETRRLGGPALFVHTANGVALKEAPPVPAEMEALLQA